MKDSNIVPENRSGSQIHIEKTTRRLGTDPIPSLQFWIQSHA